MNLKEESLKRVEVPRSYFLDCRLSNRHIDFCETLSQTGITSARMFQLYIRAAGVLEFFIDERRGPLMTASNCWARNDNNRAINDPLRRPSAVFLSSS